MSQTERWIAVPAFEGLYSISDHGRLRRVATHKGKPKDRLVTPHKKRDGYFDFWLWQDGKPTRVRAHRLVWEAFNSAIPTGLVINHKNGVKGDNRLANLEVVTHGENTTHGFRVLGRASPNNPSFGVKNGSAKLDPDKVREIRRLRSQGVYQYVIAKQFGVTQRTISLIDQRRLWAHVDDYCSAAEATVAEAVVA